MIRTVAFFLCLSATAAAAPDAKECASAYENVQRLRNEGHLKQSREQALVCADDACAKFVRQDCARWVDEIAKLQPTIVVRAIGADGCDLADAAIIVDDVTVDARGRPIPVDPGVHVVRVDGTEQRVVVVEGEHDRKIDISRAAAGTVCGAPQKKPDPLVVVPPAQPEKSNRVPTATWVLGGIGVATLAAGSAFAIGGFAQRGSLGDCKPGCSPGDVDAMRRTFAVSDISFGIAIASLVAATVVWILR